VVSVAYNFQTGNARIIVLMEYETVTQNVLFGKAILAALISGRTHNVIPQNGDCSRENFRFENDRPQKLRQ
jgi:hypothetical protein